jgi:hypothetical protein
VIFQYHAGRQTAAAIKMAPKIGKKEPIFLIDLGLLIGTVGRLDGHKRFHPGNTPAALNDDGIGIAHRRRL